MAKLTFESMLFKEKEHDIEVFFYKIFYFKVPKAALQAISNYKIKKNTIEFKTDQKTAEAAFNILLSKGFQNLKNTITGNPAYYIHKNSGIPLIGNVAFGLVDRDTNIIEIKPVTSCNLKCIYCSVADEFRPTEYIVEADYLIQEFKKLVEHKKINNIEAHIGPQGEPLLYGDLTYLIEQLSKIKEVKTISMDTNGVMLNEKKINELTRAGLSQFNLSIDATKAELAKKIADAPYDIKHIKEVAELIAKNATLYLTPVWIPTLNDEEIPKIILFANKLNDKYHSVKLGIQNYLPYRFGRRPVKGKQMKDFYKFLTDLENKLQTKLILSADEFKITKTLPLQKPFKKGHVINAEIIMDGRLKGEKIAIAQNRNITIPNCKKEGKVKLKITRSKHNIFYGFIV